MTDQARGTIIIFGEDWGSHPSSTQHIAKRLLDRWNIVWVNSIGMRRPRLSLHDVNRVWSKLQGHNSTQAQDVTPEDDIKPNVIISPKTLPFPGSKIADSVNIKLLSPKIIAACKSLSNSPPILWVSLASAAPYVGQLNEQSVVYYCGDDFGALAGVDHEPILEYEQQLSQNANLILAASQNLAERFDQQKTHIVPHGADIHKFNLAASRATDLPSDKPVIGFYGSISAWLDIPLLKYCMDALPNVMFVFIGPVNTNIEVIADQPNALFLGERSHDALATYSKHWNISILPFVDNAQIRACNPLKLREYLAAGPPIVTTDFPALDGYRDLVHIAHNAEEFLTQLASQLERPDELNAERQSRVKLETWETRANQVHELLLELNECG